MSIVLRIGLILVSLFTLIFITRKVRNAQIKLEDSIFWFCVAGLLLILSIFPQIFYAISDFAGIISPANLVFLLFIFILLILGFNLSVHLSQTDTKLKELTQQLAIEKFERYCNDQELQKAQEEENVEVVVETISISANTDKAGN
ncbi:DUF2304 domain-containing protein [Anaerotardibacter muris]|uniref:DUF2304 domain-containing protein n=1 Tax=Anaerotardibacter muris TaxID=2941505 RepID=UPI00203F8363|nr:DUF2304 domain-containing protein [Anaerotardibacter muris]